MNISVPVTITILLILLGFIFKSSKMLFVIQGFWMWILTGFNTSGTDYFVNESIYRLAKERLTLGNGFAELLSYFFRSHGFDFVTYTAVMSLVAYIIIFGVIYKKARNCAMVASLCFIFPFTDFVVQKRYFLAMAIIFLAIQYLHRQDKIAKFIYIVLVLIAFQFHSSAIFFMIPVLFNLLPSKYRSKVIIGLCIVSVFMAKYLPAVISRIGIINSDKLNTYFVVLSAKSDLTKYLFWMCWQLFSTLIIYIMHKKRNKFPSNMKNIENAYNLNVAMLCILPFYNFDPVFARLYRPTMITNYMTTTDLLNKGSRQKLINLELVVFQIIICISSFVIFYIITGEGINELVTPIFQNNWFLSWLGI